MYGWLLTVLLGAIQIVPTPQQYAGDEKNPFYVSPQTPVIYTQESEAVVAPALKQLFGVIEYGLPEFTVTDKAPKYPSIFLFTAAEKQRFKGGLFQDLAAQAAKHGEQAYAIHISEKRVFICGADDAGLFYGMQTLVQIARNSPIVWPEMNLVDYPSVNLRGVWAKGLLSEDQLQALAALKCNFVVFDSPDFTSLDGVQAKAWRQLFAQAHALHIKPVPVLPLLGGMGALLQEAPEAAEGLAHRETLMLQDEEWTRLEKRNIIDHAESPILVTVSGVLMEKNEDYVLRKGMLEYPFLSTNEVWYIRRVSGGGIPLHSTIHVDYSHVPEHSETLCPQSPMGQVLLERTVQRLIELLDPGYVLLDASHLTRLNQDHRCLRSNQQDTEVLGQATLELVETLRKYKKNTHIILKGAPLFFTSQQQGVPAIRNIEKALSGRIAIAAPVSGNGNTFAQRPEVSFSTSRNLPLFPVVGGSPQEIYTACGQSRGHAGVVIANANADSNEVRYGLERAWSLDAPVSPWGDVLNTFFNSSLLNPSYEEMLAVMIHYLEQQGLQGISPTVCQERFEEKIALLETVLGKNHAALETEYALFTHLTEYLELEQQYARKRRSGLLRKLTKLVEQQAQIDPQMSEERRDRILDTIANQNLFVPASILFGMPLLYYRDQETTSNQRLYEVPVTPAYTDQEYQTTADINLLSSVAPLRRIDLETVHATHIRLSAENKTKQYVAVQEWQPKKKAPLRGPLFLDTARAHPQWRIVLKSEQQQAVLREIRLFAEKPPCEITCDLSSEKAFDSEKLDAAHWPVESLASGFLRLDTPAYAEAPTDVRVFRTRTHLYIAVTAKDPQIHAQRADLRGQDAPLWEQESVEIRLRPTGEAVYRLVVSPNGSRYDAQSATGLPGSWDRGWTPEWRLMTGLESDGWVAVLAVPFDIMGGAPNSGTSWQINFIRHRASVMEEHSAWAHQYQQLDPAWGIVKF